jgi:hypothetical protein
MAQRFQSMLTHGIRKKWRFHLKGIVAQAVSLL